MATNFLDDLLFNHAVNKEINNPDDYNKMINELYKICEDKWKPQCYDTMGKTELKTLLHKTFNSWDLFIKRLKKENYIFFDVISKPEYSYKSAFMDNETLKDIYDTL